MPPALQQQDDVGESKQPRNFPKKGATSASRRQSSGGLELKFSRNIFMHFADSTEQYLHSMRHIGVPFLSSHKYSVHWHENVR